MFGKNKIIARIKGGLGNQLFCYAAARRLALVNSAELAIDCVTGFVRDYRYRRQYALNHFHIPIREATPAERMEPFERYRRGIAKYIARTKPFYERHYLEQEGDDFDARLLDFRITGTVYLDGYWQSEDYFKDAEKAIREDLKITPPEDAFNRDMAEKISQCNAVAMHVRWFDAPGSSATHNISDDYYQRAIAVMEEKLEAPHYFLFSDAPEVASAKLALPKGRVTLVSGNQGDDNAYADLWLMTKCRHFITANSTFSWWGAWLSGGKEKVVVSPAVHIRQGTITAWNFSGQIPSGWFKI